MNIHEIYNLLMAGKTLSLEFDSDEEAEVFRVKVSKYKTRQDAILIGIGMMEKNERQMFSFCLQRQMSPMPPLLATMVFKDKNIIRQYEVKILTEDTIEDKDHEK